MQLEKRALYHLLRMNWLQNTEMDVEEWQVADYRNMPMQEILQRLEVKEVFIDDQTFASYAQTFDTPEELAESLLQGLDLDEPAQDEVYLLLFEVWRRLLPEKPCLSIFCEDLDHLIESYYEGNVAGLEQIEDLLSNLQVILDENVDAGIKPKEVFSFVAAGLANDIESFLYDFISEQLDLDNFTYAQELYDGFSKYIGSSIWFDLLQCRLLAHSESEEAEAAIQKMIRQAIKEENLQYDLDILSFLIQEGEKRDFKKLAKKAMELLKTEEDFQELLGICADHYECLDEDNKESRIQELLDRRIHLPLEEMLSPSDPDLTELQTILK